MTTISLIFDDAKLAEGLRSGSQEAFEYVFKTYFNALCRYAYTLVRNEHVAQEMVQDCFCDLYVKRKRIVINQSLKYYLFQMVKNRSLNHLKQEKLRQGKIKILAEDLRSEEEFFDVITDSDALRDIRHKIKAALNLLPPQSRKVFELGKYSGFSYPEIAQEMGISVKTVEKQMSRALSILRTELSGKIFFLLLFFNFF